MWIGSPWCLQVSRQDKAALKSSEQGADIFLLRARKKDHSAKVNMPGRFSTGSGTPWEKNIFIYLSCTCPFFHMNKTHSLCLVFALQISIYLNMTKITVLSFNPLSISPQNLY